MVVATRTCHGKTKQAPRDGINSIIDDLVPLNSVAEGEGEQVDIAELSAAEIDEMLDRLTGDQTPGT